MANLSIAFSPCPNDTFIFHALIHGLVGRGEGFDPAVHDVEELNRQALQCTYDISKISVGTFFLVQDRYALVSAGGALGFACGPLLIARSIEVGQRIADIPLLIPGEHTTAHALLKLWNPAIRDTHPVRFDQIIPMVATGKFEAGVIIHEGRLVYRRYGLCEIVDLGAWWQAETKLPVPLGCIVVRRSIAESESLRINGLIADSVLYALKDRAASRAFIRQHAQEMDDQTIDAYLELFVNEFTLDMGDLGRRAIGRLQEAIQGDTCSAW